MMAWPRHILSYPVDAGDVISARRHVTETITCGVRIALDMTVLFSDDHYQ